MNESRNIVMFLCTGNYYRSRFAELFFNHLTNHPNHEWRAESRGFRLSEKNPGLISRFVINRFEEMQIPMSAGFLRAPMRICEEDFKKSRLVIALDETEHRAFAAEQFPGQLNEIEFWNVPDTPLVAPSIGLRLIELNVLQLVERLFVRSNELNDCLYVPKLSMIQSGKSA